eukprot:5368333-Lingulodinium_polyedra.AAC.1
MSRCTTVTNPGLAPRASSYNAFAAPWPCVYLAWRGGSNVTVLSYTKTVCSGPIGGSHDLARARLYALHQGPRRMEGATIPPG